MLVGEWAIALNLASMAVLCFLSCVLLLSVLWPLVERGLRPLSAQARKSLLWTWAGFPSALALTAMILLTPVYQGVLPTFCLDNAMVWHHVDVFSVTSWHGVLLALSPLPILWVISTHGYRCWRRRQELRLLTSLSGVTHRRFGQAPIVELDADQVGVFSTDTTCYLTRGLHEQLSAQELDIVTSHEQAHIARRDSRSRMMFSLLSAFYPTWVARRLRAAYCLATEQLADQAAVQRHTSVDVAATLVKVARLQQKTAALSNGAVAYFAVEQVSLRVQHLLDPDLVSVLPLRQAWLPIASVVLLLSLGMVDGLHHLAEIFFSH